jgi:hypothetical protein
MAKVGTKTPETAPIERDATLNKQNIPEYAGEDEEETAPAAKTEAQPVAPQSTTAAQPAPKVTPAKVEEQIRESLGGTPTPTIKPGVTMRNQAAASSLPEGFTPVKSSALQGYKYDAATQEFDAITNTGQRFRHGEVTQDQFDAFEKADSKGKAWSDLRNSPGVTPLGKVDISGKLQPRVKPQFQRSVEMDPETGQPEFSDVIAAKKNGQAAAQPQTEAAPAAESGKTKTPTASTEEDLTSLLQKSLEKAKPQSALDSLKVPKGGISTTADPAMLTKRWGVTNNSIADTDSNLRGMNEKQSQEYVNKLAQSYKNGRAVEPVLETRDADNNIVDVDGRHRALAAAQAGIKKIPIIVRRLGVTAKTTAELGARPK